MKFSEKKKASEVVVETWPLAFNFEKPKPLMNGITSLILAETNNDKEIKIALSAYFQRITYIRCVSKGGPRYNLQGEPEGEVSKDEQESAKVLVKQFNDRWNKKRLNIEREKLGQLRRKEKQEKRLSVERERLDQSKIKDKQPEGSNSKLTLKKKSTDTAKASDTTSKVIIRKKRTLLPPST